MRALRSLLIYLTAVFIGGALFAPWLYWLVQWLMPSSALAENPFRRFVERSLLAFALIGLWPFLNGLGVKPWLDGAFTGAPGRWGRLARGFLLGFGSFACIFIIVLVRGARYWQVEDASQVFKALTGAAAAVLVVPLLEEFLFRGAVFGALRRDWDWRAALLASSTLFALVHFVGKPAYAGPVRWNSGLELLPSMFVDSGNLRGFTASFINLTLVGATLCLAYQRTGDLSFSIGLHGGWVFLLKSYAAFTNGTKNGGGWFWGTDKLVDGWLAMIILFLTLLSLSIFTENKSRGSVS